MANLFSETSLLAGVKVWEKVTVEGMESVWIFGRIEAIDAQHIPIVFYVRVTERDLRRENVEF